MTFPAEYFSKELAGQSVTFDITVKEVGEPVLPEADADFAKGLGVEDGDLVKMRAEIEANLKREVKKRLQAKMTGQVMDSLLQANPIDVPGAGRPGDRALDAGGSPGYGAARHEGQGSADAARVVCRSGTASGQSGSDSRRDRQGARPAGEAAAGAGDGRGRGAKLRASRRGRALVLCTAGAPRRFRERGNRGQRGGLGAGAGEGGRQAGRFW
jgi:hypothetical protein